MTYLLAFSLLANAIALAHLVCQNYLKRNAPKPVDASKTLWQNGYNYAAGLLISNGNRAEEVRAAIERVVAEIPAKPTDARYYDGMRDCLKHWQQHAKPSKRIVTL